MSQAMSLEVGQVERSLRIVGDELSKLKGGLKSLENQASAAAKESNLTFLEALAKVYGDSFINLAKLGEYVEEIHQGILKYQREVEEYERSSGI